MSNRLPVVRLIDCESRRIAEGLRGIPNRDPQNTGLIHLHILIDAQDLVLIHKVGGYTGSLRVAVVGYLPSGRVAETRIVPFELVFRHGEAAHQRGMVE
jgi:hypothetical protein